MPSRKSVQEALDLWREEGFTVTPHLGGSHWKITDRAGRWVSTVAKTTNAKRVVRNERAQLRRVLRGDYSQCPGIAAEERADRKGSEATAQPEQEQRGRVPSAYLPRERLDTSAAIPVKPPKAAGWAPQQRDKSAANWARHQARRDAEREDREREKLTATTECAGCGRPVKLMSARFSMVQAESRRVLQSWCQFAGIDAVPAKLEGLSGWNVPLFWCATCAPDSATEYSELGTGVLDEGWLTVWTVTDPRSGQELRDMFEEHLLESLLPILTGHKRKEK